MILEPLDKDYQTGFPKAIDIFFQFFIQKRNDPKYIDKILLSLIPEEHFQESLLKINAYRNQQKVKRVSLNGVQIKKFQGIKDTQISALPQNSSWILLTGENSFGKTCLLKALAIGLYGDEEDIIIPRNKDSEIQVNYRYEYDDEVKHDREIDINNNIRHPLFFRPLPALAAYGPSRLEIQAQDSRVLPSNDVKNCENLCILMTR
ncbi:MAG: hypothetical protein SVR94_14915 [Pseudomonadota bacterium]|nr:hypothetical protein [Pseudomonadota bacterium]